MQLSEETLQNLSRMDIELPKINGIRGVGSLNTGFLTLRMECFVIFCKKSAFVFSNRSLHRFTSCDTTNFGFKVGARISSYQIREGFSVLPFRPDI